MNETRLPAARPEFDPAVEPGGYRWWYLDAISDDGEHAITTIVFIGSVFSPYYAWARARGGAQAQNHCAVNVALYGRRGKRWAMTERGAGALATERDRIRIGPSKMCWTGSEVTLDVDEVSVPLPARIRGRIRLIPEVGNAAVTTLDDAGRHAWQPIFPSARIEVRLQRPSLSWQGTAYFDTNAGSVPLEQDFIDWDWSRAHHADGSSEILYDRRLRSGERHCLARHFAADGTVSDLPLEPELGLPTTRIWRIPRSTRGTRDSALNARVKTLEDTPFYARSLVTRQTGDREVTEVHESLSMTRFTQPWVQVLLPFRMPRLAGPSKDTGRARAVNRSGY